MVSRSGGTDGLSLRSGSRLLLGDPAEDLGPVAPVEGRAEGEQLVESHPERVDVSPAVDDDAPGQGLLGAHVAERAEQVAGEGQAVISLDLGQPEVGHPDVPLGVEEQVAGFDVPVEDAAGVGVVQRLGGLQGQAGRTPDILSIVGR